jgi:hypothetical protein
MYSVSFKRNVYPDGKGREILNFKKIILHIGNYSYEYLWKALIPFKLSGHLFSVADCKALQTELEVFSIQSTYP